jgi:hypothetical protein
MCTYYVVVSFCTQFVISQHQEADNNEPSEVTSQDLDTYHNPLNDTCKDTVVVYILIY